MVKLFFVDSISLTVKIFCSFVQTPSNDGLENLNRHSLFEGRTEWPFLGCKKTSSPISVKHNGKKSVLLISMARNYQENRETASNSEKKRHGTRKRAGSLYSFSNNQSIAKKSSKSFEQVIAAQNKKSDANLTMEKSARYPNIQHNPNLHALFALSITVMPKPLRSLLADSRIDPRTVDAKFLINLLPLEKNEKKAALRAFNMDSTVSAKNYLLYQPQMIPRQTCEALKGWAEKMMAPGVLDSVDGAPEWQVHLDTNDFRKFVGDYVMNRICSIVNEMKESTYEFHRVGVFIRKYTPHGRPLIPFHVDQSNVTVNIALSDSKDYVGGELLLFYDKKLCVAENNVAGDVLFHRWDVAHGVRAVVEGQRFGLVMFFYAK